VSRSRVRRPIGTQVILAFQLPPRVPEVAGDAPSLRVLLVMPRPGEVRVARGQGEGDRPPRGIQRLAEQLALLLVVRRADIVHLHVVDAPGGPQLGLRLIPSQRGRVRGIDSVHVKVPAADPFGGDVPAGIFRPQNRQTLMGRLAGNAAHNMDAEFEPHGVNLVGKGLETGAAYGRGKPILRRDRPPVGIQTQGNVGVVLGAVGSRLVPLDVHDHIFPSESQEVLRHVTGVAQHLFLRHAGPVTIPAVPPHGRNRADPVVLHQNLLVRQSAITGILPYPSLLIKQKVPAGVPRGKREGRKLMKKPHKANDWPVDSVLITNSTDGPWASLFVPWRRPAGGARRPCDSNPQGPLSDEENSCAVPG